MEEEAVRIVGIESYVVRLYHLDYQELHLQSLTSMTWTWSTIKVMPREVS